MADGLEHEHEHEADVVSAAGGASVTSFPEEQKTAPVEAPFYIPSTSGPARPRRTVKHDETFAVFDSHGDIGAAGGAPDGLFHADTRYLSHLELLINGTQPLLLGSGVKDDNLSYDVDLTNPDLYVDGKIVLLKDTVHIARTIYLYQGSLRERIAVANHGSETVRFTITLSFAADFADIFEVRGIQRKKRGQFWSQMQSPRHALLSYKGLDDVLRETALSFEPQPDALLEGLARYDLTLAPGERRSLFVAASSRGTLDPTQSYFKGMAGLHRLRKTETRTVASVETSNGVLNEILCRSAADLAMLLTRTPQGPYPYAGIPWYSTTFGRDGIITAMQMLWMDPAIALGVLRRLAHLQATTTDPAADAEPGKILHEMRGGEMARLGEVPFSLYYGSIDATPLFVMLLAQYYERTGDIAVVRELWPAVERALAWIDRAIAADARGFLSYARATRTGLANQGWKDSHDSVFAADGRLAQGPIALVEVQGYVYAARRGAAQCAAALGREELSQHLLLEAEVMRRRFEAAFWSERIGSYAIAIDGEGRPCEVLTSNAGHALFTEIASPDRASRIAAGLMERQFYSGWGIRTVAQGQPRYNPMSYHNGSIWPHDNAIIAQGLARYGLKRGLDSLFEDIMRSASYMDHRRMPELYCGFRRRAGRGPTLYPAACSPQAWAAGTPFHMLQSLLGLEFDPAARQIRLVRPRVPASAGDIVIRNLRLGEAVTDFAVRQHGDAISVQVLRTSGDVQVLLVFDGDEARREKGR